MPNRLQVALARECAMVRASGADGARALALLPRALGHN